MSLDAVVDIGNSRIKFCRCGAGGLNYPVRAVGIDAQIWDQLATNWQFKPGCTWAVAATQKARQEEFVAWAKQRGDRVLLFNTAADLPIEVDVDEPSRVGVDRLLNVLAARSSVRKNQPAIVVDAGSAVTVDLLDEQGRFAGGTIFPGLRLMALALHEHTSALPLIDASEVVGRGFPGKNTEEAMTLGIQCAIGGGIDMAIREIASRCSSAPKIFLTGGDMTPQFASLLQTRHQFQSELRSTLTLEGILAAAESK